MRDGIEFSIRLLKKAAARHDVIGEQYASKGEVSKVSFHYGAKEACLGAVKLLQIKLRLYTNESAKPDVQQPQVETALH